MTNELEFSVDAHLLRAAWACRATGQGATDRPYLAGVYLERAVTGGVTIVATDGTAMAVFHDKGGRMNRPSALLDFRLKNDDAKLRRAERATAKAPVTGPMVISAGDAEIPCRDVSWSDWTFPQWRRVAVPQGATMHRGWPIGSRFSMNSAVMMKVYDALRWADPLYEGKRDAEVHLEPYHWKGAVQVAFTSTRLAGYVIAMPGAVDSKVMDMHFHIPEAG